MIPSRFDLVFFWTRQFAFGHLSFTSRLVGDEKTPHVTRGSDRSEAQKFQSSQTDTHRQHLGKETHRNQRLRGIHPVKKKATSWKMIHLFHDVPNYKGLFIGVVRLPRLITGG